MALRQDDPLVIECARHHMHGHSVFAGGAAVAGTVFCLLVAFAPFQPAEHNARIGIGVFGAFCLGSSFAFWLSSKKRLMHMIGMLTDRAQDVSKRSLVQLRVNGVVARYAIDLTDKDGKVYRLSTPSERAAKELLERAFSSP
jgi:hypothetical protein